MSLLEPAPLPLAHPYPSLHAVILMMMKNKNLLLSLIISNEDLNAAFIVAGFIFATVPIGLYGIIKAMKATKPGDIGGLKLFNWSLVLCGA